MSSKNGTGAARKHNGLTGEVNKEIIIKHENNDRVGDIANEYSMGKINYLHHHEEQRVNQISEVHVFLFILSGKRPDGNNKRKNITNKQKQKKDSFILNGFVSFS
jgi:hypothetical protein